MQRLARLDAASSHGSWTRQALELIDKNPAIVSTVLAAKMALERAVFKIDIRKLKESGLTESLEVGYRLSPRGKRLLDHLRMLDKHKPQH
jgi:predicted transcriptional regulator